MQFLKYIFLWCFEPIEKIMQHIGKEECLMDKAMVDHMISIIEKGDILLSHEDQRLTSMFIKGFWDHAAIVNSVGMVTEAVGSGVHEKDLEEWLYKKDYVVIIRHKFATPMMKLEAAEFSRTMLGMKYDFQFTEFDWSLNLLNLFKLKSPFDKKTDQDIYCSEAVKLSWRKPDPIFMKHCDGKEILPQEYFDFAEKQSYLLNICDSRYFVPTSRSGN